MTTIAAQSRYCSPSGNVTADRDPPQACGRPPAPRPPARPVKALLPRGPPPRPKRQSFSAENPHRPGPIPTWPPTRHRPSSRRRRRRWSACLQSFLRRPAHTRASAVFLKVGAQMPGSVSVRPVNRSSGAVGCSATAGSSGSSCARRRPCRCPRHASDDSVPGGKKGADRGVGLSTLADEQHTGFARGCRVGGFPRRLHQPGAGIGRARSTTEGVGAGSARRSRRRAADVPQA